MPDTAITAEGDINCQEVCGGREMPQSLISFPLSLQLYITLKTTTTEVIRLVVQQLEKARFEKHLTTRGLTEEDLADFYLVCINGKREWTLESGFNPLQLQTQASKCRLFVRRQSEEVIMDEQATTV